MSFMALVARDMRLATRAGGSAFLALAFFAMTATLVPLGIGAETRLLSAVAAGIVWICAVLAGLLSLDRLFQADFEDGSLDVLALGPLPLESIAAAKIAAHWLVTGLPLTLVSPMIALLFSLPGRGYGALAAALAIGTPAVSAIGAIGASLTISIRRGGLILPFIVMPLLAPIVIFGAGAVRAAIDGLASGALLFLAAASLAAVVLSPFAAAAGLRLNLGA
ncbi:MAG TPA: heme exporter protein CcmB [Rhizomicrobium sp.]|jgi:heme exporter protein B|nr:heme exporter protein CcmB [Rhizomicrobium sp.]